MSHVLWITALPYSYALQFINLRSRTRKDSVVAVKMLGEKAT